ncbi:MAG: N-acetyltransferase, partial [Bacteroidales bacterium]
KVGKRHVRFGWLDFVEDENVLKALLETVEAWAKAKYAEYIHGPLGFSSFDASGILIEGFNEIPTSFAHYNFPYYSQLIEKLGYKKEAEWIEYNVKVPAKLPERFLKGAALIKNRYGLQSAVVRKKKDLLKYSDEVFNLLNREYEELYAFTELTKLQVETLKEQFIPLLNLEYTSIILNREGEVIAFGIAIPSLSKALQKSRGKLFPFGFLYINRALHKNDTVDLLLIAIRKDFRRKGVNGIITNEIMYMLIRNGIKNVETTRELQNNLNISNLWGKLENRQHKKSLCYVKQL